MSDTRAVVQLQQGPNHLGSVKLNSPTLNYLQLAMMVRSLNENYAPLFPKTDHAAFKTAADRLCSTLKRANDTRLKTHGGNNFREQFQATINGKRLTIRIDIEIAGTVYTST